MILRAVQPDDLETILNLMGDFAAFEGLGSAFSVTEQRFYNAIFGNNGFVSGLIAFVEGKAAGYALFYPYFSSFRGEQGYYLEDLFVLEKFRGLGIGEAFLRTIASSAAERGYERIDFGVLNWNKKAIGFYEKLGAVGDPDERHYKFVGDAFRRLALP